MHSITAEITAGVWFFALGAILGSFLNVVAYRLPRSKTLLGASHCPYCRRKIAPYDNLPIFGWLLLQGRCRNCRLRISPRYPLVELLTACVFFSVAIQDFAMAATHWAGTAEPRYYGFAWNLFDPRASLIALYAGHVGLMSVLIACLLIERDRQPLPRSLIVTLALIAVATAVCVFGDLPMPGLASRCWGTLIGAVAGILHTISRPGSVRHDRPQSVQVLTVWGITGFMLGGYATVSLLLISALVGFVGHGVRHLWQRQTLNGPLAVLFWSCWVQLLVGSRWVQRPGGPLDRDRMGTTLVWLVVATMAVLIPRLMATNREWRSAG